MQVRNSQCCMYRDCTRLIFFSIGLQNQGSSLGLSFVEGVVIVILQMLAACASQIRCQFRLTPALRALAITILRAVIFQRYQRRTPSAAFLALYVNPSQGMLKRCVTVTPYGVCCPPLTASQNPIRRCRHWKAAEDAGHMFRRGHSSTFTLDLYISARCTQGHMDGMTTTTTGGSRFEPLFQALGAPPTSRCATEPSQLSAEPEPNPNRATVFPFHPSHLKQGEVDCLLASSPILCPELSTLVYNVIVGWSAEVLILSAVLQHIQASLPSVLSISAS